MKRFIFLLLLLPGGLMGYCQDTTNKLSVKNLPWLNTSKLSFDGNWLEHAYLNHSPKKEDYRVYKSYSRLVNQQPTVRNYRKYYALACSLWELNRLPEAETMFLRIINSRGAYYCATYYHPSDIPGDKSSPIYGYGSYTSSYKNSSAIYLAKINIEQKKFSIALYCLDAAVNKYKAEYSCGTGYLWQKQEYDALYASCYRGIRNKIVHLLVPGTLIEDTEIIVNTIKDYLDV